MKFSKIYVEITNICNLNCSFCSKDNRLKKEMSVDDFKIIIGKIKDYTRSIYLHIKGEPLLHSKLDEIINICDENNIKVNITTNGTLLKEKQNILLKHQINQINVSLHCENNIKEYFTNIFKSCDLICKNTTIVYRIWVLDNLELDDKSKKIVNRIIDYYKLNDDIKEQLYKNKNIKIKDNIYLDKDNKFTWPNENMDNNKELNGTCLGTKSHIGILSNGDVVPCCLDTEGFIKLGNIYKDNLENIMNSSLFKEINQGFKNKRIIHPLCQKCTYRKRFK